MHTTSTHIQKSRLYLAAGAVVLCSWCLASTLIPVAAFRSGDLVGWTPKQFSGETVYLIVDTPSGKALRADSRGSASGLVKKMKVDLTKTPFLHWSWQVGNTLSNVDEKTKQGDDYPARVYVIASGPFGLDFWRTRAISYVWASALPEGEMWANAFTSQTGMIAVRSGASAAGQWVMEKRNVREDFRRYFKQDVREIHAVALMTDTDNSGQTAIAYYGDMYFSEQ